VLTRARNGCLDWGAAPVPRWTPCPIPNGVREWRLRAPYRADEPVLYTPASHATTRIPTWQSVANAILGDGMSSRLFLRVREEQGLAYDVGTSPITFHDSGAFVVSAGVKPGRVTAAVRAILDELALLRAELIPADELTRAKSISRAAPSGLEDTHSVAWWLATARRSGRVRELDDVLGRHRRRQRRGRAAAGQSLFRDDGLRLR